MHPRARRLIFSPVVPSRVVFMIVPLAMCWACARLHAARRAAGRSPFAPTRPCPITLRDGLLRPIGRHLRVDSNDLAFRRPRVAGISAGEEVVKVKFVVKKTGNGEFRFNLVASNGQVVATSESYKRRASALNTIASIQKSAGAAKIDDETTGD